MDIFEVSFYLYFLTVNNYYNKLERLLSGDGPPSVLKEIVAGPGTKNKLMKYLGSHGKIKTTESKKQGPNLARKEN